MRILLTIALLFSCAAMTADAGRGRQPILKAISRVIHGKKTAQATSPRPCDAQAQTYATSAGCTCGPNCACAEGACANGLCPDRRGKP